MRLAADEITIRIGGETIYLRPTLRAAMRLERRFGFPKLLSAVSDGNLGIMAEIIREASDTPSSIPDLLGEIGTKGLRIGLQAITVPCLSLVASLAGLDDEHQAAEPDEDAARVTFAEHHERLFRIATGALGWTPETAWNSTPAEIIAAYEGRRELITDILTAVFGPADKDQADDRTPDDKVKAAMASIGTRVVRRERKAA